MKQTGIAFFFGLIITSAIFYKLFFQYTNHADCELGELQKLSYKPEHTDRVNIQLYCEIKFPYEKEIYGPSIEEWNGPLIKIHNDSNTYRVTKVKIYAQKDECGTIEAPLKEIIYHVNDGTTGGTFGWSKEYTCYRPQRTKFFGKIQKESFTNY